MSSSEELLKDTVFQLLGHHQNYDKSLQEILSLKETCEDTSVVESLTGWRWFSSEVRKHCVDVSCTTDVCVKRLLSLSSCDKFGPEQEEELQIITRMLQQLKQSGTINLHRFTQLLSEHTNLPVQIVWTLHKEGIFTLEMYVQMLHRKKSALENFVTKLCSIEDDRIPVYTSEIVSEMLCIVFSGENTVASQGRKKMVEVVDQIILGLVDKAVAGTMPTFDFMLEFKLCLDLEKTKKAYTHLLTKLLCHRPVMKVSQAIKEQEKWSYGKISPALTQLYKQFLLVFDVSEILTLIREILEQQEVNWQLILSLVSEVVVCMPESSKLFLDFIDNLLGEGLENREFETTIMGMLLARQACFQGPHVFLSYSDWFQRAFADSSKSMASSRKSFTFLMSFLTNIVPYESAEHIRVHILRPPFVPPKCRQVLADYIILAKTRLADLKETLDTQTNDEVDHSTGKNNAMINAEVDNAVKLFETTKKVPTSVLESSIFRKPYYVGQFLPVLLQPRPLPDFPDAKVGLIEALKKADKIPISMYTSYQKACKKEASQLFEGVFIDSDSDCDMELSPFEQLDVTLQQFKNTVNAECLLEKSKHSMSEVISLIIERLENILLVKKYNHVPVQVSVCLETQNLSMDSTHIKIVDMLLNVVAESIQDCYKTSNPVFTWVSQLLTSICMFSKLAETLYKRIWMLIINQGTCLENHHIDCVSSLLVEIQLLNDRLPLVTDCVHTSQTVSKTTLTEYTVNHLSLRSSHWMNFSLQLFGCYLKYLFSIHQCVDQYMTLPVLIKKFYYLATRKYPILRCHDNKTDYKQADKDLQMVSTIHTSDVFQNLAEVLPMAVEEWVGYEIQVCVNDDTLTDLQRYEYFSWVVYKYFLPRQAKDQNVYSDIAACIVTEILHTDCSTEKSNLHCSKCDDKQTKAVFTNSRSVMIQLLYEMIQMMFACSDQGGQLPSSLPWLPQQLLDMLKTTNNEISQYCTTQHFFRLCLSLPPYLMFTNSLQLPVSEDPFLAVLDFINTSFRQYLCEGIFLPPRVITYILQGVIQNRNVQGITVLIQRLCQQSPLIFLSVSVHSDIVRPLLQRLPGEDGSPLKIIDYIGDNVGSHSSVQDPWQLSVILFSKVMNTSSSHDVPSIWNELTTVTSDGTLQKHVCCNLVQMLILQLTYVNEFMESKDRCLEDKVIMFLSHVLNHAVKEELVEFIFVPDLNDNITRCANESIIRLKGLTTLKLLEKMQKFTPKFLHSSFLDGVLKSFIDCNNLLDKCEDLPQLNSPRSEINKLNEFVATLIAATEKTVLYDVDQELLLQAGPTIADCAIRIMSS